MILSCFHAVLQAIRMLRQCLLKSAVPLEICNLCFQFLPECGNISCQYLSELLVHCLEAIHDSRLQLLMKCLDLLISFPDLLHQPTPPLLISFLAVCVCSFEFLKVILLLFALGELVSELDVVPSEICAHFLCFHVQLCQVTIVALLQAGQSSLNCFHALLQKVHQLSFCYKFLCQPIVLVAGVMGLSPGLRKPQDHLVPHRTVQRYRTHNASGIHSVCDFLHD
mmetsp:Transcript_71016/g.141056  ORF Transcript_71016/g.141056 Transcript_71016/m.141056 type:complete len:224 (+) Transcript_71016:498-1169(+)